MMNLTEFDPLFMRPYARWKEFLSALWADLLEMDPAERPDGIISDDDTVVSGLLAALLTRQMPQISYLPQIATIIHDELGEKYPSDRMILFRQKIEEYAAMAVDLLLDVLRGYKQEQKQLYYRFTPVSN